MAQLSLMEHDKMAHRFLGLVMIALLVMGFTVGFVVGRA